MQKAARLRGWRKRMVILTTGTTLAFPMGLLSSCELSDFTTTSTVTMSAREVVLYFARSAILTPIENALTQGVDRLFDKLDEDEDDD